MSRSFRAKATTASLVSFLKMGTITTSIGASRGGRTRPLSSECAMMIAPMRRVEEPQDVAHTWSRVLSFVWKVTSNAFAKFWPRKWDVPACSDFLSCIMASMQ